MLNKPDFDMQKFLPYLTNVRALIGVVIVLFAAYTGCTDVPPKWKTYFDSIAHKNELIQNKKSLKAEEVKLNRISKELDKSPIRVVLVPKGASPDLILIKIAQKAIDLSELTGNTYVGLQPGTNSAIDVNSMVTLPINIPGAGAGTDASAQSDNTSAAPSPLPAAGGASAGNIDWASGALGLCPYTLTILGTYPTLSKFVEEFSKIPEFIQIRTISLDPSTSGGQGGAEEIVMKVEFAVPWKPGTPPPEQGVLNKPSTEETAEGGQGKDAEAASADEKKAEPAKAETPKKPEEKPKPDTKPAPAKAEKKDVSEKPKTTSNAAKSPPKPAKVVSPTENGRVAKRKAG